MISGSEDTSRNVYRIYPQPCSISALVNMTDPLGLLLKYCTILEGFKSSKDIIYLSGQTGYAEDYVITHSYPYLPWGHVLYTARMGADFFALGKRELGTYYSR